MTTRYRIGGILVFFAFLLVVLLFVWESSRNAVLDQWALIVGVLIATIIDKIVVQGLLVQYASKSIVVNRCVSGPGEQVFVRRYKDSKAEGICAVVSNSTSK